MGVTTCVMHHARGEPGGSPTTSYGETQMTPVNQIRVALGAALTLILAVACTAGTAPDLATVKASDAAMQHARGTALTADQNAAIARVRNATARFHDIAVARDAGYDLQFPEGCKFTPEGAQGFHYLDQSLVDDKIELLKPELVMYEPQRDGSLQLVGVDYIVPFTAWTSPEAPTLLGVPFMRNEPLGVWALHIWAWRPNPSGMFAMWNPSVSCANAK